MLPGLRFIFGAALGGLTLILMVFGLAATVRITQQTKIGPIEPSSTLAYADPTDWNPFYDGDASNAARSSQALQRKAAPRREPPPREAPSRQTSAAAVRPTVAIEEHEERTGSIPAGKRVAVDAPPVEPTPRSVTEPEPAPQPAKRVANLPSPSDPAAVAVDTASREAVAPTAEAGKVAPKAKRRAKAKKKVAKRRARAPAAQPNANPGFSTTSTNRSANGSWPFPN